MRILLRLQVDIAESRGGSTDIKQLCVHVYRLLPCHTISSPFVPHAKREDRYGSYKPSNFFDENKFTNACSDSYRESKKT